MFIRCGIMALIAAYLNFLSQMIANPAFCQHVSKVYAHRYTQLYTFLLFTNLIWNSSYSVTKNSPKTELNR